MSRMNLFGVLAVVVIAAGGIAVIPRSQGKNTETSKSKIEAVGLAKYGLEIIDPEHPAFRKLMAEKKPGPEPPFSVFVANNSGQAISSCTLKCEILLRDGQTVTHFKTKTGTLETVSDGNSARLTEGIAAKGTLLFSLTDSASPDNQARTGIAFRSGGGDSNIINQLSNSVKVTVSIDGALFVDGTYVGPDTNNYFELFRGQIEANRDLDGEIDRLANDGAKPEAIINHLERVSHTQSNEVQIPPGEDPQYSFGKWMQKSSYARLLLVMRKKRGDQAVLDHVRTELSKPQITLRKLKES
jgi:hypothetical protein